MIVHPTHIQEIRRQALDAIKPAFFHSDVADADDWIDRCIDDKAQLWHHEGYWVITEIQQTKRGLALHLVFSAGTYSTALISEIERWAKGIGCNRSYFSGRPGCVKKRPDYSIKYVTMEKEL